MGTKVNEKLEIVTMRLFEGDKKKLDEFYPDVGYNQIVRTLVRRHIKRLEEKLSHKLPKEELDDQAL